ncbi:MAG: HlyD family efflux transporter periplasmic adaptor subunit [Roseiflexus sp.]|nr:HlyD family efflux transporter periplasmic adaptor subunit [Roseiflexus sp.]MCS7288719.1 HlyD family efflux transporter periplasmic adaptor subunit [Roseiflexus sp.]MDW8147263.1 HlyD family efflux transporter periplasmic adaptor subunit [Roseiflexaceae bacterium]MDW8232777.1 HlyD family efflux transporter periplasmic adaptor subunit [Roseiflexaceae bacterium]
MRWMMRWIIWCCVVLLTACGTTQAAPEPPTPTPLPPDPALERPTYRVQRGVIEQVVTVTARATPVDMVRLAFRRDGRVNVVNVRRGDVVKQGDILAELQQEEALDELRRAEDDLAQARRDLESARLAKEKRIKERELDVERARRELERLLPGGEADLFAELQERLETAQRELRRTRDDASWSKTSAEEALLDRAEALSDTQKAYSTAYWNWNWVQRYGTDPENPFITNEAGVRVPNLLTEKQKEEYRVKLIQAERALRDAERNLEQAQRARDRAYEDEIVRIREAEKKVEEAQRALDMLLQGKNKTIEEARLAFERAQVALEEARNETLNSAIRAVENAERALEKARRRVNDGRVIAPQNGTVLAVAIEPGATVTAFEPVIEVADPSNVEFAATLSPQQMRLLSEGQSVEIRLLSRPDLAIPGVIRRMPAPYGSGGSGAVQDRDATTRFQVVDARGQTFEAGVTVARVSIVLERKENVLWLPPEAIRSFEGRRFVILREGERERRVPVRIGIETEERVEILEGLDEGDIVVGS